MSKNLGVKVYHGFGHKHDIVLFGHVFQHKPSFSQNYSDNPFVNMFRMLRLFFVKPLPRIPVKLQWGPQTLDGRTELDGFYRFEWVSETETAAGWYQVEVQSVDHSGQVTGQGEGKVFIPHITQYAFISDIDDTVMVSHSSTIWRRMKELLFKNSKTRMVFSDVAAHYKLLAQAHTTPDSPNPFFYVSSSEWNLYDYLRDVFQHKELPEGAFLLNQVKRWYELWKTGKTKHEGKLLRILRIFQVFPNQRFILMGDNSQSDPGIYAKLGEKYADRIFAVYIRLVNEDKRLPALQHLDALNKKGIHTLLFEHSSEAIAHSRAIGLIS